MSEPTLEELHDIAEQVHDVAAAYNTGLDERVTPWDALPPVIQDAAVNAVRLVFRGARASELQAVWRHKMEADGWTYGPMKNYEKKEHPGLVPYGKLPLWMRAKDALFVLVARGLLAKRGHLSDTDVLIP